jgi:hypothetical protein
MADSLYNVILDGEVIDGFNKQETQDRLARLFKIKPNVAARMLNGVSLKVKEAVDLSTAEKYRETLEKAGAKCRIEEISLEIDLDVLLADSPDGSQEEIQPKPIEEKESINNPGVAQEKAKELSSSAPSNEPIPSVIKPASINKRLLTQKNYIAGLLLIVVALMVGYFIYIKNNSLLPVEKYKEAIVGNWSCGKKSIDNFNNVITISDSLGWSEFSKAKDEDLIMWFSNKTDSFVGNVMQQSNTVNGALGVMGDREEIIKSFSKKSGERPFLMVMPGDASSKITILAMSANAITYTQDKVLNYCNRISAAELANYLFKSKQPATSGRLKVELTELNWLPGSASPKPDENVLPQAAVTLPSTGITIKLTDTGITDSQCYAAGSNSLVSCNSEKAQALSDTQDGMKGRDAEPATNDSTDGKLGFSYIKLGDNGQPLAIQNGTWSEDGSEAAGSKWSCVKDNVTGLIWEVKTDDGGLRDKDNTYTNYEDSSHAEIDAASNSRGFVAAVNRQGLCGARDWRLPKLEELHSLVDYGVVVDKTIDANVFPNTSLAVYWSSSPYAGNAGVAWGVLFYNGSVGSDDRSSNDAVRLVRASQ